MGSVKTLVTSYRSVFVGIVFGAACTLSHMGAVLRQVVETLPPYKTEVFLAVLEQLRWFAGLQIRNVAVSLTLWTWYPFDERRRLCGYVSIR